MKKSSLLLHLLLLLPYPCLAQYPSCLLTNAFSPSQPDRPSVWQSLIGTEIGNNPTTCLDARGEIVNESSGALTTTIVNPFAASASAGPGGQLYLPAGLIKTTTPFQMYNDQYHVHGSGDGATLTTNGFPTIIQAEPGIALGSGTSYTPAVVAFGLYAGQLGTTGNVGPFRQTCDNLTIDANQETSGVTPMIGLSMYSGQEGTGCDHIYVTNSQITGLDWCGNFPKCGDGLMLDSFAVTHTMGAPLSCVVNSTSWTVNQWNCQATTGTDRHAELIVSSDPHDRLSSQPKLRC